MKHDASDIESWLTARFAHELNVPAERLGAETPLVAFGLDSLTVAEISGELETWLEVKLEPTLVWDHPTIRALAEHLARGAASAPRA